MNEVILYRGGKGYGEPLDPLGLVRGVSGRYFTIHVEVAYFYSGFNWENVGVYRYRGELKCSGHYGEDCKQFRVEHKVSKIPYGSMIDAYNHEVYLSNEEISRLEYLGVIFRINIDKGMSKNIIGGIRRNEICS